MKKKSWILIGFIFIKFTLQYILISPEYELHRDEYLYLDQAHHLAWGYLSVPPVTSWISSIIYLLGNSVFWVKFFPALFGALTIIIVWKTIEELKGNLYALILGATGVLFSALLRLNTLYQPSSLDVLCWSFLYFVIVKYFNTENTKWLFAAALIFAFGFLNKYNIVFLIIGLVPAILFTDQRKIFLKKELYLAILLGVVVIFPNLFWQYNNDFPVIHHLEELAETQLANVDRIGFLKSQLYFFIGSILPIICAIYALLFYKPFQKYKSFFWAFFFTLTVFMYFRAKDYYAIGLYPIYISFGSVFLADFLKNGWKQNLRPIALAIPILFFIPIYQIAFPNKSPDYIVQNSITYKKYGLLRWEDGKDHSLPQDYADMLGWEELARKVDSVYIKLPNADQTLVLCDNYGQAGAINYYTKQHIKAVSFNADYVNWFNFDRQYINLIRIKYHAEKDNELIETSPYFNLAYVADSITNPYAREFKTLIFAFIGAKVDVNKRIKNEIEETKNYR
ncbi:glycosyltransferase family 39 protein [Arenibacter echinorum]|uniref:Dolichyl-phosphate-mannose-protein mannosyltransferase n=1 Tax=Arenibacter echinorum TaxID=440515 RepID=A0A327R605_9FLAO|nr:glycosyltransferase family 39 protein [Arenibacter echinorum]RAJ12269.1 dolichyl-phosphate-mannose-protein mannosyltransferase [Arenibacter echinorum]